MAKPLILEDVKPEHHFWAKNGTVIRNLPELIAAIERMDEAAFLHHVNKERNDFGNWVRDIIKDKGLAEEIYKAASKEGIIKALEKRLGRKEESKKREKRVRIKKVLRKEKAVEAAFAEESEVGPKTEITSTKKPLSNEFLQGLVLGILLALLGVAVYNRFFSS